VKASGHGGALLAGGYEPAATIEDWSLAPIGPDEYQIKVQLVGVHTWWITQRPMSIALRLGNRTWRWDGVHLDVPAGEILVRGNPETR
jgi:hypothetical protein